MCIYPTGQVRSECLTCTFRISCCSECLSWAPLSGTGKERGREKQSDRCRYHAEHVKVLWILEWPAGLSQKGIMYAFQIKEIGPNFGRSAKR